MALLAALVITLAAVDPTDDVRAAAELAGVSEIDLQGAVSTTGLGPLEYLYMTGELKRPRPAPPYGLSPYLARVAACESINFRPDVVYGPTRGRAGEVGLAQLHPAGLLPRFMAWVPVHLGVAADPWNPTHQARFLEWAFANNLASHWSCR